MQLVVHRPPEMETLHMNEAANRVIQELKLQLSHLDGLIERRQAGNGKTVRCIDATACTKEDIDILLQYCIWKGKPLIIRNTKGVMDWRPQVQSCCLFQTAECDVDDVACLF